MKQYDYPELGERLYTERLSCGLRVCVIPRPGFSKKQAYFATNYGSICRDFTLDGTKYHTPAGVAHFLEHKMFDLPGNRDVSAELAALGAGSNAFTSFDMTAYYISCTENFEKCLRLLLEFVSTPYFTQESVEKEIGIIDQEIDMNLDAPDSRVFDNLSLGLYREHEIRVPILGTSETIRQITPEILYACHRAFYTPANMALTVIGDVDPEKVCKIAEEILGTEEKSVGQKHLVRELQETALQPEIRDRMEVSMPTFALGFKCTPAGDGEAALRQEIVGDLACEFLAGEASELYLKLYEQRLIDSSFGGGFDAADGASSCNFVGDSIDPVAVRREMLNQAKKICRDGIPEEDFLRMKRSTLGRRIRDLDSFDMTSLRVCAWCLEGFDYFRFPGLYQTVTGDEVVRFIRNFITEERCCLSVIDPISQEA